MRLMMLLEICGVGRCMLLSASILYTIYLNFEYVENFTPVLFSYCESERENNIQGCWGREGDGGGASSSLVWQVKLLS